MDPLTPCIIGPSFPGGREILVAFQPLSYDCRNRLAKIVREKVMRIVVFSDTHIPARAPRLPEELLQAAREADMVLHAGDFTNEETLWTLGELPRFKGVAGNMDGPAVRSQLKDFEIIEAEGVRILLTHGWGAPGPLPNLLRRHFDGENLDVIVYGHSHRAFNEVLDGILLFNPGSPTDKVFAPYRSYGILEVDNGSVKGEIVKLGDFSKAGRS